MYRNFLIVIIVTLAMSNVGWAQKNITDQTNGWYMYFGNHKLSDKYSLHTEYQWRRNGVIEDWQQSLTRIGLDYKIAPSVMVTAGYGYIVSHPYGDQPVPFKFHEHRIWEQLILTQNTGRFYFNHRFRLEQRYIENRIDDGTGSSNRDGYTHKKRARYRFMVNVPINKPSMEKGAFFASVYDEVFLQYGPNFANNYLDQNRLYGALGYVLSPSAQVQVGYLNQYVIKGNAIDVENNHTLQFSLTYHFDFRKKKTED